MPSNQKQQPNQPGIYEFKQSNDWQQKGLTFFMSFSTAGTDVAKGMALGLLLPLPMIFSPSEECSWALGWVWNPSERTSALSLVILVKAEEEEEVDLGGGKNEENFEIVELQVAEENKVCIFLK